MKKYKITERKKRDRKREKRKREQRKRRNIAWASPLSYNGNGDTYVFSGYI